MSRLGRVDLNLLVYLDALLRERNVTQAAHSLGLSQPAMSNGLKRLREVFNDPLLIRTSDGMTPTAKAEELEPQLREILTNVDRALQPTEEFVPERENRVVRLMASDYAESTLLPYVLKELREQAPGITLDIMNPSDVSFLDVERGKVDLVINRFAQMPQSFHQITLWQDTFSCLLSPENPILETSRSTITWLPTTFGSVKPAWVWASASTLMMFSVWAGLIQHWENWAKSVAFGSLLAIIKPQ
jgi:DNA-binding transcriptional LysR family regulator